MLLRQNGDLLDWVFKLLSHNRLTWSKLSCHKEDVCASTPFPSRNNCSSKRCSSSIASMPGIYHFSAERIQMVTRHGHTHTLALMISHLWIVKEKGGAEQGGSRLCVFLFHFPFSLSLYLSISLSLYLSICLESSRKHLAFQSLSAKNYSSSNKEIRDQTMLQNS